MKKFNFLLLLFAITFVFIMPLNGCKSQETIKLYDVNLNKIVTLALEDYVAGATAAEMDENFSSTALETQAILCRTYAYYFKENNLSKYAGADISNDITEAQAYTTSIPDKIKTAVKNTKGKVIKSNGKYILPYYCSNCGGASSLASDVFNITANYLQQVETLENEDNSKNYYWQAEISKFDILYALSNIGISLASVNSFIVDSCDASNRALTFNIGGKIVDANSFRLAIGNTILKSCLITNITVNSQSISFEGLGYGHGVGLSQWGANILASQNYTSSQIINYFYKNCEIVAN